MVYRVFIIITVITHNKYNNNIIITVIAHYNIITMCYYTLKK